jgi:hypothetical protein
MIYAKGTERPTQSMSNILTMLFRGYMVLEGFKEVSLSAKVTNVCYPVLPNHRVVWRRSLLRVEAHVK